MTEPKINELDEKDLKILQQILSEEVSHYQDIFEATGFSKKTISNHLNHVEDYLEEYNIGLVRKKSIGILIDGSADDIARMKSSLSFTGKAEDNLTLSILSKLVFLDKPVKIQELADIFFESRGVIESRLQKAKKQLDEYDLKIVASGKDGLTIEGSQLNRRKIAADLLFQFWNISNDDMQINNSIIGDFLDKDLLEEIVNVTDEFIEESKLAFTDYEKESLIIHLAISLRRIMLSDDSSKPELLEKINSETKYLVELLQEKFSIVIPQSEQEYLDIHIRAVKSLYESTTVNESQDTNELTEILIKNINEYDSELLNGLTLHLLPAIKRLKLGLNIRNPLKDEVKVNFVRAYEKAIDICKVIAKKYDVEFDDDEISFIALHFESFIERDKQTFKAYVVCSSGLGTAQLLKQRIIQRFSNKLEIIDTLSKSEFESLDLNEYLKADIIISTIQIESNRVPDVKVNPFLDNQSIQEIEKKLTEIVLHTGAQSPMEKLIKVENVIIKDSPIKFEEAVALVSKKAVDSKVAKPGIDQSILQREAMSSTFYDDIALPHAEKEYVLKPTVYVLVDKYGILKQDEKAKLLFFLLVNEEIKSYVDEFYSDLNEIVSNKSKIKKILKAESANEVTKELYSKELGEK